MTEIMSIDEKLELLKSAVGRLAEAGMAQNKAVQMMYAQMLQLEERIKLLERLTGLETGPR